MVMDGRYTVRDFLLEMYKKYKLGVYLGHSIQINRGEIPTPLTPSLCTLLNYYSRQTEVLGAGRLYDLT